MRIWYYELYAYTETAIENVGLQVTKWALHLTATRIIKFVQTKDYNNTELSFVGKALKQDWPWLVILIAHSSFLCILREVLWQAMCWH